ncbi:DUF1003 domain-containing protein [Bosea sp. BIWAKO-01]|uniref:DUF1003 domain-containing protein n=1 Tax=Bosea sp. BIWAKO-01 TaxID=506668 RepID=UPI00086F0601|nr:DUF1003 domain-containing protein [Bosea sp. BIWAKO-01]GAU80718.1 hypothetical protein BIWAKO_00608 [Bosea sp. BIWAKO-01]
MTEIAEKPSQQLAANGKKRGTCAISGVETSRKNLVPLATLRPSLAERIQSDFPQLTEQSLISKTELARYRTRYVEEILREEHGEYTELDREVVESIAKQDTIAANVEDDFEEQRTVGQRLSDGLAAFGGSWAFLISFGVVLAIWMMINVVEGMDKAFDPYPFILLNLVLSCIAAIQAPIIMMSQKRQEQKDRLRSFNDYQVNLKAELEIRHLHEKIDHLITRQWQRLAEIQQVQLEMLQEESLRAARRRKPAGAKAKTKRRAEDRQAKSEPDASA